MESSKLKHITVLVLVLIMCTSCMGQGGRGTVDDTERVDEKDNPGGGTQPANGVCEVLDIVLILDHSGSISFVGGWDDMKKFSQLLILEFIRSPDAYISIITFSSTSTLRAEWMSIRTDLTRLNRTLAQLPPPPNNGETRFGEAFRLAEGQWRKRQRTGNKLLLIVTDGIPNLDEDRFQARKYAERLRGDNVRILSVGVGDDQRLEVMREWSDRNDRIFEVDDFPTLVRSVDEIRESAVCQYDPDRQNRAQDIPGDDPNLLEICSSGRADVVFLIDGSISISDPTGRAEHFFEMRDFTSQVLSNFNINPNAVQVGIYQFGIEVIEHYPLDRGGGVQQLEQLLSSRLPFSNQRGTDIGSALNFVMRQVFNTGADRPEAPNVIVVVTDGKTLWDGGETWYAAQEIDQSGVKIITVGFTATPDATNLQLISSQPQQEGLNWFRSGTDLVAVTGTSNGIIRAMCGLDSPQPASPQEDRGQGCPKLDITFIIDSSGSISFTGGDLAWALMRNFTKSMIRQFVVGVDDTHISIVTFSNNAQLIFDLNDANQNLEAILRRVDSLQYTIGETNMYEALNIVPRDIYSRPGDRQDARNVIFFITDGYNTGPSSDAEVISETIRIKELYGSEVYVIGVTSEINERHLRQMASRPIDVHSYIVQNFRDLQNVVNSITGSTGACLVPTVSPAPAPDCSSSLDLVFFLDSSGSVQQREFELTREFVYNVLEQLDLNSENKHRVGVTTFANSVQQGFYLGEFRNKQSILAAVEGLRYTGGRTQIHEALRAVGSLMFTTQNDRPENPNIVVFFTNGQTSDRQQLFQAANEAKARGIQFVVFGIGNQNELDMSNLKTLASYPYQVNLITLPRFDDLRNEEERFRNFICNNVNECSSNPCRSGGVCADSLDLYACLCPDCFSTQNPVCYGGVNCDKMCREPSDLIVTMDASGSITREQFYLYLDFFTRVVEDLPIGNGMRMGLQTFSQDESVYFDLNDYSLKLRVLDAMMLPYYSEGRTNVAGAIENVRFMLSPERGDRPNVPNKALIFTDGISTINIGRAYEESLKTRKHGSPGFNGEEGVTIIAVGVGPNVRRENLEQLASFPSNSTVLIERDVNRISNGQLRSQLVDLICNNVDECASNPCQNGGQCVDKAGGYVCRCSRDFTGRHCERRCSGVLDLVLAIDSSGSIRRERFPTVQQYMVDLVNHLEVHPDKTRIGAVLFSTDARTAFYLNEYDNKKDVQSAILRTEFINGRTNLASALSRVRNDVLFNRGRGSRENVPKMMILFSDGKATENEANTLPEAVRLKLEGVTTISVAVGGDHDVGELFAMTSDPISQNLISVNSISNLPSTINRVIDNTCYDENVCMSSPCQNGGQCVDGYTTRDARDNNLYKPVRQYTCTCRPGTTGVHCQLNCRGPLDVAIVVDISGSVDSEHMLKIDFTKAMVRALMGDNRDGNRMGLISFDDSSEIIFSLNEYQSEMKMLQEVALKRFSNRGTNIYSGLQQAEQMFNNGRGDRSSPDGVRYRNVIVLVTDGAYTLRRQDTISLARRLKANTRLDRQTDIYVASIGSYRNENVIQSLAGRGQVYDYRDYVINVDYSRGVTDITNQLLQKICNNMNSLRP